MCMLLRAGGKNNKVGMGAAIGICLMGVSIGVVMGKVKNRRGVRAGISQIKWVKETTKRKERGKDKDKGKSDSSHWGYKTRE